MSGVNRTLLGNREAFQRAKIDSLGGFKVPSYFSKLLYRYEAVVMLISQGTEQENWVRFGSTASSRYQLTPMAAAFLKHQMSQKHRGQKEEEFKKKKARVFISVCLTCTSGNETKKKDEMASRLQKACCRSWQSPAMLINHTPSFHYGYTAPSVLYSIIYWLKV